MAKYSTVTLSVATAGVDGAATGSARRGITTGELKAIMIDFSAGQPATLDWTLTCVNNGVTTTLASRNDSAADLVWVQPMTNPVNSALSSQDTVWVPFVVAGELVFTVSQADDAETAKLTAILLVG